MEPRLIEPLPHLLDEVMRVTGKRVEFIPKKTVPSHALLRVATQAKPAHLIYYQAAHDELLNHRIAHQCGHLLRIFRCPEDLRLTLWGDPQGKQAACKDMEGEMASQSSSFSERALSATINRWYGGILRRLAHWPPNLMIEKWLDAEFPSLREVQRRSLQRMCAEAAAELTEAGRGTPPPIIQRGSGAMDHALFSLLEQYLGTHWVEGCCPDVYAEAGEALAAMMEKNGEDSHEGDRRTTDAWASFLHLTHWFTWRGFEEVPPTYSEIF